MALEITREEVEEYRKRVFNHVCAECGGGLIVAWGGAFEINNYIVRCGNDVSHNGIARNYQPSPYDLPGWNLSNLKKEL